MLKTINVTQRDIDRGNRGNGASCAIALAAKRSIKQWPNLWVYAFRIAPRNGLALDRECAKMPEKATQFVYAFDRGMREDLKPFRFKVEVPD